MFYLKKNNNINAIIITMKRIKNNACLLSAFYLKYVIDFWIHSSGGQHQQHQQDQSQQVKLDRR